MILMILSGCVGFEFALCHQSIMADIMLDLIYEVVKKALEQSNLMPETRLVKHYTEFCITLKLKNWTNVEEDGTFSNCTNHLDYLSDEDQDNVKKEVMKHEEPPCQPDSHDSSGQQSVMASHKLENVQSVGGEIQESTSDGGRKQTEMNTGDHAIISLKVQDAERAMAQKRKKILKEVAKLKCPTCSYKASTKKMLQLHSKSHKSMKSFQCPLCNFNGKSNARFIDHLKVHTGEKPFKCDSCDYEGKDACHLKQHQLKHSNEKMYFCKYCDYRANYKNSIYNHERVMHTYSGTLFQCSLCDFKTLHDHKRLAHVTAHEQNIHFDCNICGKVIYDKTDFKYHLRKHNAEPRKKNIVCSECDKKFYNNAQLTAHMFQHTGKKEFKCRLCGLEYCAFAKMKKHFLKRHSNEKVFRCEPCDFVTSNLRENNRHAKTTNHMDKVKP